MTALRAIIGRMPPELKRVGSGFEPRAAEAELARLLGRARRSTTICQVRIAQANFDIATLEVDRAEGRPLADRRPGRELQQTRRASGGGELRGELRTIAAGQIGVQLNVPIYKGGFVDSKVPAGDRAAGQARQDLEAARRAALFNAQTGFSGVNSARRVGEGVRAGGGSAQVALQSNRLGQEVGVRTNLDVLNAQQNVFSDAARPRAGVLQVPDRGAAAQVRGRHAVRAGRRERSTAISAR